MPYNLDIPGQVSEFQLKAIELVASLVPESGHVVEVGSLFGRSSWAWAKSVAPTVMVNCIDPWSGNEGIRATERRLGISYGLEQFREFTRDCPNIRPCPGYSPRDFQDWGQPVDLYYEDAVHNDPILADNLAFWSSRLTPAGILCGDDYRPRFPDVRAGAKRLADKFGRQLITVDFFWCLLPPEDLVPAAGVVAQELAKLSAESDAANRARGTLLSIGPMSLPATVRHGQNPEIEARVTNEGIDRWPVDHESEETVIAGVRIVEADSDNSVVGEIRENLGLTCLEPDTPVQFRIELPLAGLAPGDYRIVFDTLDTHGRWRAHPELRSGIGVPIRVTE